MVIKAPRLLQLRCKGFLCNIVDTEIPELSLKDIPVVQEIFDVFLDVILGMPPLREVKFYINLVPKATPISKTPYRMA